MAVAIRQPADVKLPADVKQILEAMHTLTTAEKEQLARELVEAVGSVRARDDFSPVVDILDWWFRTALLRQQPDWPALREELEQQSPREGHSVEELRRELSA